MPVDSRDGREDRDDDSSRQKVLNLRQQLTILVEELDRAAASVAAAHVQTAIDVLTDVADG